MMDRPVKFAGKALNMLALDAIEQTTLLSIWRETCRHIDLAESIETAAGIVAGVLPIRGLLIRRFDPSTHAIETLAIGHSDRWSSNLETRTVLPEGRFRAGKQWATAGMAEILAPGDEASPAKPLAPPGLLGQFAI